MREVGSRNESPRCVCRGWAGWYSVGSDLNQTLLLEQLGEIHRQIDRFDGPDPNSFQEVIDKRWEHFKFAQRTKRFQIGEFANPSAIECDAGWMANPRVFIRVEKSDRFLLRFRDHHLEMVVDAHISD